jgi:hypothetical protein
MQFYSGPLMHFLSGVDTDIFGSSSICIGFGFESLPS